MNPPPPDAAMKTPAAAAVRPTPCDMADPAETNDEARFKTTATAPIAHVEKLSKSFGSLRVLDQLTLSFKRGEITVIIGPSGTGKSVLIKHMVVLLKPEQGEIFFDGQRVDNLNEQDMVPVRKRIGFCFQMGALFDSMTVADNIAFPLTEHTLLTPEQRMEKVDQSLKMVLLSGVQNKLPTQLSGGQRKRVALARSIILEPDLVLYDEPTTGLDPIRTDVIDELVLSLNQRLGISSIVVTHDIKSATKIADRMILLYNGRVIEDGTPQDFCHSENPLVKQFMQGQAGEDELLAIREGFRDGPHLT